MPDRDSQTPHGSGSTPPEVAHIQRADDRVNYLCQPEPICGDGFVWNHMELQAHQTRVKVIRWNRSNARIKPSIDLGVSSHPFSLQVSLTATEARAIAAALLQAALEQEQAEAAPSLSTVKDEVLA